MISSTKFLEGKVNITESLKQGRMLVSIFLLPAYIAVFYLQFANRVFCYGRGLNPVFQYLSFFEMTFLHLLLYLT